MGIEYFIIMGFCIAGASLQAYKIGVKTGSENTIDVLHEQKIISYDHEGNIVPNPYFKV